MLGKVTTEHFSAGVFPALGRRYEAAHAGAVQLTPTQLATRNAILQHDRAEDWEEARCLCGESAGVLLSEIDRHGLPYMKRLCEVCGLLRVSPRWNARRYSAFYANEYRALYKPLEVSKEQFFDMSAAGAASRDIAAWVVRTVGKMGAALSPTTVEIGAGGGWNLANLPSSWTRIGFDVDDDYLAVGRSRGEIDLRRGFLEEAISTGCVGAADVVLLSHVVEHFIDPVEQLGRLRAAMKADAVLLIEVPGVLRIHRTRQDPMRLMQNAHIHTFCAKTLAGVCERSSYRVLDIDETVRAVCRPHVGRQNEMDLRSLHRPGLSRKILGYLRFCERGTLISQKLRRVPLIGRLAAAVFRRLWFPAIGMIYRE